MLIEPASSDLIAKDMVDLFVSGFLHSGLISEENVIEDSLSLLKLFYILMDILP